MVKCHKMMAIIYTTPNSIPHIQRGQYSSAKQETMISISLRRMQRIAKIHTVSQHYS